ncbi:MAG: InlB B-repeat-containing protein [Clostridia bacterium]|nr:InlB B-repeat-containing protein [Clostridia bacterium]
MKKKLFIFSIIAVLIVFMVVLASCGDNGGGNTNTNTSSDVQEYTIQYTDNTGNHTITVKNGDVYSLESIPSKTGYTFKGLFDLEEGGTQYVSATGNSVSPFTDNKNVTLYPQFDAKEYTIILDYQGAEATGTREIVVTYDSFIGALPTNLYVQNKNFTGWYTDKDMSGTQIADSNGVLPDKKLVNEENFDLSNKNGYIYLYAGFEYEKYTLTLYIGNSSVPEEITVEWGTYISSVQTETRVDGKAVLTWSKNRNDTYLTNVFDGKIESDMILYSCEYAPVIDFDSTGGNKVNSIVAKAGDTITIPTPERENYNFVGWFDTNGTQFTSTTMPENSLKLNAKWQPIILLNENGGTDVNDISAIVGEVIELPTPKRDGYVFAGWYKDGERIEISTMPENSITLSAGWYAEKIISKTVYNGGASSYKYSGLSSPSINSPLCFTLDYRDLIGDDVDLDKLTFEFTVEMSAGINIDEILVDCYNNKTFSEDTKLFSESFTELSTNYYAYTFEQELDKSDIVYICFYTPSGSNTNNSDNVMRICKLTYNIYSIDGNVVFD